MLLKSMGIPVNSYLPFIEENPEVKIRSPQDTAKRAIVLRQIVAIAYGDDPKHAKQWLESEQLWECVSPSEIKIFESEKLEKQLKINTTWRCEALYTLLWALKKVDQFNLPTTECEPEVVDNAMPTLDSSCADFINTATLRTVPEILYEAELIYDIHWAMRDARLHGRKTPGNFIPGVVSGRHYALNWLTCDAEEWDKVTTDT